MIVNTFFVNSDGHTICGEVDPHPIYKIIIQIYMLLYHRPMCELFIESKCIIFYQLQTAVEIRTSTLSKKRGFLEIIYGEAQKFLCSKASFIEEVKNFTEKLIPDNKIPTVTPGMFPNHALNVQIICELPEVPD